MIPNPQTYVDLANARIMAYLLPDVCTIYPIVRTADGTGGYDEAPGDNRLYKGSDQIPCRLDPSKQYKDSDILTQETTITTYTLYLPPDADVSADDTVIHNGNKYAIKQVTDDHSFRSSKILYLVAVK